MAESSTPTGQNEKKRKRPRAARACELCRAKKYRCDEMYPCSHCKRQKVDCVYDVADHVRQRLFQTSNRRSSDTPAQVEPDVDVAGPRTERPSQKSGSNAITTVSPALNQSRSPKSHSWTRINAQGLSNASNLPRHDSVITEDDGGDDNEVEVSDVNPHTQNVEFHGKTSSLAFLAALQPQSPQTIARTSPEDSTTTRQQQSLVSMLHNEQFSPEALANVQHETSVLGHERYYFRQAQLFLDGYFQNIHFIHPILDRPVFMARCEDLWFDKADRQPRSFVALYYSILSLGALIRTWDEEKIDGLGRLEWSRKLFNLTRTAIGSLASMTAVESVQCLFFMAKISQNELNPSLAYLYLGWATRSSCSAGFNRRHAASTYDSNGQIGQIPKLWWGLYSLEMEVSFALGRPDSLGADAYHNQVMPPLDESETAIITVMVEFAKIIREVSLSIYLSDGSIQNKTAKALDIEKKMNGWLQDVPIIIRPSIGAIDERRITKAPTWAKRQKLVLELRYYNVKMVLFRPFLTVAAQCARDVPDEIRNVLNKCVDAASSTIELIHNMYCQQAYFRTWWYNTTYVLYAASIVLCYAIKVPDPSGKSEYLELGRKAVEILDAMEESTVARNASRTIMQILSSVNEPSAQEATNQQNENSFKTGQSDENHGGPDFAPLADDSLLSFLNLDGDFDFLAMTFPLNSSHFPNWTDADDHI